MNQSLFKNKKKNLYVQILENINFQFQKFKADSLGNVTSTIVQFSGVKGKESDYEPDSNGCVFAGDESLKHYNIEFGPHVVSFSVSKTYHFL